MTRVIAAVVLCALVACGGGSGSGPSDEAAATRTPPPGGSIVRFDGGATAAVEIADSREEHLRGLMGRTELGADDGMLFVFPKAQTGGFWMKNTLIPLSIAYLKRTGERLKVVAVREMTPCRADPCPAYPPGAPYDAALEMNEGWFERHGIAAGDTAEELADVRD